MQYSTKDFEIAKNFYKTHEEKCERFARSIHKLRESRKKYDDSRTKKSIVILQEVPDKVVENRHVSNICQATTMSGKKCSFKASCGRFCKKHSYDTNSKSSKFSLGVKPDLKKILL